MTRYKESPALWGSDRAEDDFNGNVQQTSDNPPRPDDQELNDLPPPWLDAGPYLPDPRADFIYGQLDRALEIVREMEHDLVELRRKPGLYCTRDILNVLINTSDGLARALEQMEERL